MRQENIDFLNANRHHWELWKTAQIFNQLDSHVKDRLLRIVQEEFSATYIANLWCSPCVVDLLKFAYTQFDKYLEQQQKIQQQR